MRVDLKDRVVIVTGGGGAIGGAMAEAFAENGAKVVVAGRTIKTLEAVVETIKAKGGEASAVIADVSDRDSAANMVAETVKLYGRLDVLVNNAGINGGPDQRKPIHEYSDELWERIINVDLNGVYYCSKPAIQQMEKQGQGGNIINIRFHRGPGAPETAVRVYRGEGGRIQPDQGHGSGAGALKYPCQWHRARFHYVRGNQKALLRGSGEGGGYDVPYSSAQTRRTEGYRRNGLLPGFR